MVTELINQSVTRLFVGQPRLHRVCQKSIPPNFLEKIILITRTWRKSVFRVWQLSMQVPIKMLVSSLTELHTPSKTLIFSTVSKKQPLFKLVIGLNPVFQSRLTVTIFIILSDIEESTIGFTIFYFYGVQR